MAQVIKLCIWMGIALNGIPIPQLVAGVIIRSNKVPPIKEDPIKVPASAEIDSPYVLTPKICTQPPAAKNVDCCIKPMLFKEEDFIKCGLWREDNGTTTLNIDNSSCSQKTCVLARHNLLNKNGSMSLQRFDSYLNEWIHLHPAFKSLVVKMKEACARPLISDEICILDKLIFCYSSLINFECPVWRTTENCAKLKEYKRLCSTFFLM